MTAQIDPALVSRIKKLLNLAKDGGATEAEAATALEKARELMAANNLAMATLEASGTDGGAGSKRTQDAVAGKALYKYQQRLMGVIAETNYCAAFVQSQYVKGVSRDTGYIIVGREANVIAVVNMFDYLNRSLERIVTPHLASNAQRLSKWAISFKEGAARRLGERLEERFTAAQQKQSQDAREANASAAPSAGALVVVLEDYAQQEEDANRDLKMGWAPGTALQHRIRRKTLLAQALADEEKRRAALSDEERAKEDERDTKQREKWEERTRRRHERYWANRDMNGYWTGHEEADKIGLDDQITDDHALQIK